ncbi:MAG: molybdopterin molybdotransferase MoeA [Pseudomonadales bacterium]|jgi:molybdopterin molybdotransferase|nr:molybdopterin molybdenumtransferase MoeA [Gammaproteobacteria bacterium]MDP6028043.1 molybdopterin molybdotransferase MoeA [Pseudomonadales bacterium]MDP6316194.1 molybdopterin molybdotransferase MoeA [Pseudomonadales bacterium]MDP7316175.1 molybdopterin molybdotransferase MoeA [Pseudomonadales bacterium]MDP7575784.1 molybdopterin molybdotransferase MoeA [Pseudomonadales bacterium]|tara:strand:- start:12403 stop:13581 length:1179 start_codon:yes stop_codon:yes gene_type:complete
MITQSEAHELMITQAQTLGSERVELDQALNRILAEDVHSDMDMPPFRKAAMDGYACQRKDIANDLAVVEILKAGAVPTKTIGTNECAKIMTGGMIPDGADCVIIVEETEELGESTVRFTMEETRDNLCEKGEDIQTGDVVLTAGTLLRSQHMAMLASVGCVLPNVTRRPRVGIVATGDELVEPDVKPDLSQIRTSNSHQIIAQVQAANAIPNYYGIARDTEESLDSTLKKAMSESDVVLLTGGVSMGDLDLVPGIMKANNVTILFEEIAVQPGKPTTFGVSDGCFCVGLPGSPVAAFTQFELLVKPFLYRLMGHVYRPGRLRIPMAQTRSRARTVRENWFPFKLTEDGAVLPCEFHGSAHVESICEADGLGYMPIGVSSIDEGDLVTVRFLQ